MELERMAEGGADPRGEDLCSDGGGEHFCGRCDIGGRLAPCSQCEWGGLCPEYANEFGGPAGGGENGSA